MHSNYERSWCSSESCDVFSNLASTNGNGLRRELRLIQFAKMVLKCCWIPWICFTQSDFFLIFFKMPWILGQRCEWNVGKGLQMQIQSWRISKSKVLSSCRRSQCWQTRLKMQGVEFFVMPVGSQVSLLLIFCHLLLTIDSIYYKHVYGLIYILDVQGTSMSMILCMFLICLHMQQAPSTSSRVMM